MSERVIVALSGGVDSAVAALLLKRAGHELEALHMTNWQEDEAGYCTAAADWQDARRIAAELDIPIHHVSFAAEYRERVFKHFLADYAAGLTPNPDILCNREVKFGACLNYMRRLGGSELATGHYARIARFEGRPGLCRARDADKDQSYFLQQMPRAALGQVRFPLGELVKGEVRELARAAGLPVHDRPDSTGICFIGERPFRAFLETYLRAQPGPIETPAGERLGTHDGLMYHTIGQRQGLKIGGLAHHAARPWYVAGKDLARNALIVVQEQDHPLLLSDAFEVEQVHWLNSADQTWEESQSIECAVKTRYRQNDLDCTVQLTREPRAPGAPSGAGDPIWRVILDQPARAVTPGQYAVFYRDALCLGGGVIARRFNSCMPYIGRGITYNSQFSVEGS